MNDTIGMTVMVNNVHRKIVDTRMVGSTLFYRCKIGTNHKGSVYHFFPANVINWLSNSVPQEMERKKITKQIVRIRQWKHHESLGNKSLCRKRIAA